MYKLFTPGPVDVPADVRDATARPLIYHREARFTELMEECLAGLRVVMGTKNKIFLFTASGTGALEAACANLLDERDRVIVAVCGKFGERWLELCTTYRVQPHVIKVAYGKTIPPHMIEDALRRTGPGSVIFTTLTETSTGVVSDIAAFGEIARRHEAFLVVDGVAGIGADPCPQDAWHVDVLVGASQKALMTPPGVSFLSMSERALEKTRQATMPRYYFNLALYEKFYDKGQTPWTPAITIMFGLRQGLKRIQRRGVKAYYDLHRRNAEYVRRRIGDLGLALFAEQPSNALTVITMPEGVDSTGIIEAVKRSRGILFANGQGELRGKILRIGHMGNYTTKTLGAALDALEHELGRRKIL